MTQLELIQVLGLWTIHE